MTPELLARELADLGYFQVRTKAAAEALGVSVHSLRSVLQGRRGCPEWLADQVRRYRDGVLQHDRSERVRLSREPEGPEEHAVRLLHHGSTWKTLITKWVSPHGPRYRVRTFAPDHHIEPETICRSWDEAKDAYARHVRELADSVGLDHG